MAQASNRPFALSLRSSTSFIGIAAFTATFNDGFLYGSVVPVLPFSLVDRSGVPEEHVQAWLSVMLMVFGAATAFGAPIAGYIIARSSSRKTVFTSGIGVAFLATVLFCFGKQPWVLVLARAVQGLAGPLVYVSALVMILDSVDGEGVGAWIGLVLTGMNLGLLVSPLIAGAIYDSAGYYAVFGVALGLTAVDFALRILIIEKRTADRWLGSKDVESSTNPLKVDTGERDGNGHTAEHQEIHSHEPVGNGQTGDAEDPHEVDETSSLLHSTSPTKDVNWFARRFPVVHLILTSRRLMTAYYGGLVHTALITSFDAVLPLKVQRTFDWDSTAAGMIFLAITIPSLPGNLTGRFSDRFGTRVTAMLGFAFTVPGLGLLAFVKENRFLEKILLCVFLSMIGTGLNFILSAFAGDIFHESMVLAKDNPETLGRAGKTAAFAQVYSLFNAALGIACIVGPGLSGLIYEKLGWTINSVVLASITAVGGVLAIRYTGPTVSSS